MIKLQQQVQMSIEQLTELQHYKQFTFEQLQAQLTHQQQQF